PWSAELPIPDAPYNAQLIFRMCWYDSDTIVGSVTSYGPLFKLKLSTGAVTSLGVPRGAVYDVLRHGDYIYAMGYPSAFLDRVTIDGLWEDLGYINDVSSAHTGMCPMIGADGKLYIIAYQERYAFGFGLAAFDPVTKTTAKVNDGGRFANYRFSWAVPIEFGNKLVIATTIESPQDPGQPARTEAKLVVYHVLTAG